MPSSPTIAAFGRLLIAVLFLMSGLGKLANPAGTIGYIAMYGLPLPSAAFALTLLVEIAGGLMLLVGYRTRLAGLVLAVFTIAAALVFHTHFADQNQMIHFLKNVAITGGLLQVAAFGAGSLSLDARLGRAGRSARAAA